MTSDPGKHPSPEELPAFGLGLLDDDKTAAIASHVASCDSCCKALAAVADDAFVSRLRDPVATTSEAMAAHEAPTVAPGTDGQAESGPPSFPPELAEHPRYRLERLLGAGGMGAVYQAYHRIMDRTVVLKVISRSLTNCAAIVERFTREVKAAARLSHPNIVTAFDAEQAGGSHFLVMEFV
jgi:hypothetical protein